MALLKGISFEMPFCYDYKTDFAVFHRELTLRRYPFSVLRLIFTSIYQ